MAQKIQVRRGTAAELAAIILDAGEPGYTTDSKLFYIGDGVTEGGILVGSADGLFVDIATQAIAAGIATQAIFTQNLFESVFAKYTLAAGGGAYSVNLFLPTPTSLVAASLLVPCTAEINLEFATSANPTVNIYDSSIAGTLEAGPITNPAPSAAAYWYGKFKYGVDGHWHKITSNWN